MLSDRLVAQNGILLMGGASLILMILTAGSVRFLVVLYSINVFITFALSQLGMVRHWWKMRKGKKAWLSKLFINGFGLVLTSSILVSIVFLKFNEGGWITILVTTALIGLVVFIKRHYNRTAALLKRLDDLVEVVKSEMERGAPCDKPKSKKSNKPKTEKTAVLLVNGFTGFGLHTLFNIFRIFGKTFNRYIFLQIAHVDAGVFKSADEVERFTEKVEEELDRYVKFVCKQGYEAVAISTTGIDVVQEVTKIAPEILKSYPGAVFFGGQLVFPKEPFFSRWLHNYTIFAIQRQFYYLGIPVVILPIRVQA